MVQYINVEKRKCSLGGRKMNENLPMVVDAKTTALTEVHNGNYMKRRAREIHNDEMDALDFGMAEPEEKKKLILAKQQELFKQNVN